MDIMNIAYYTTSPLRSKAGFSYMYLFLDDFLSIFLGFKRHKTVAPSKKYANIKNQGKNSGNDSSFYAVPFRYSRSINDNFAVLYGSKLTEKHFELVFLSLRRNAEQYIR